MNDNGRVYHSHAGMDLRQWGMSSTKEGIRRNGYNETVDLEWDGESNMPPTGQNSRKRNTSRTRRWEDLSVLSPLAINLAYLCGYGRHLKRILSASTCWSLGMGKDPEWKTVIKKGS